MCFLFDASASLKLHLDSLRSLKKECDLPAASIAPLFLTPSVTVTGLLISVAMPASTDTSDSPNHSALLEVEITAACFQSSCLLSQ